MKLRNKKTGEIIDAYIAPTVDGSYVKNARTLSELTAEWEDCEEPTGFIIDIEAEGYIEEADTYTDEAIKRAKEVGNYFETKGEAEKAVEKLKALKKLKEESGLVFNGWKMYHSGQIVINAEFFGVSPTAELDLLLREE